MNYPIYVQTTNPTNYGQSNNKYGCRCHQHPGMVAKTLIIKIAVRTKY